MILAGALFGTYLVLQSKKQNNQPQLSTEVVESTTQYSASYNEASKQTVVIPDPLGMAITTPDELGNVFLAEEAAYHIQYFSRDKAFNITLLDFNLLKSRVAAQEKLLQLLGVSEEDLCKLNIYVGVPFNVSEDLAGQNLGLSF